MYVSNDKLNFYSYSSYKTARVITGGRCDSEALMPHCFYIALPRKIALRSTNEFFISLSRREDGGGRTSEMGRPAGMGKNFKEHCGLFYKVGMAVGH